MKSKQNNVARLLDQGRVGFSIKGLERAKTLANKKELRSPTIFLRIRKSETQEEISIKAEKSRRFANVGEKRDNQIPWSSGVIGPY